MSLVQVKGLSVVYGRRRHRTTAVSDLDLTVAPGETVAVVGESGSGKTTLASALLGLLPASASVTAGTIEVAGHDLTGGSDRAFRAIRGTVAGLVPQDPMVGLNPTMRIGPQVAEAVRRRPGLDRRTVDLEVVAALEAAGLDDPVRRARQYPHELSGGLRQRVLIAIALAGNPQLIIADEPTSALDVTVQKRILDHLTGLVAARGLALLIITHNLAVAAERAGRVVVMHEGRVVEQGAPGDILVRPREAYTRRLVAAVPRVTPRFVAVPSAEPILTIAHVTKSFKDVRAVDDVSLTVPRGQTLALVGESGSGKTTTLRIALGLERPDSGRVLFDGVDLSGLGWRRQRPLRRRFQLVHQNPYSSLDPRFTVAQTVTEPLVSFRVGDRASRRAAARDLIDRVGLPETVLDRRPAELSGGQRQRVAIARSLALRPDLLLLDEPVSALDVSVQDQILRLLADLQRDLGLSYLLVSHDLAVVAQVSHHVAVLHEGRVVEHGPTASVFASPSTAHTRRLLDAIPGPARQEVIS
ncbi:dipeptide ABC transporter ATP-binding protein [Catenuloplanes sp. NPDC051500]|uniref:dipeptide ABC transporter ATP-binding protein n=1 Tax=Catenuloplanes sp. NPDC051500 TaxID=3363959 RepID=UPI0037B658BD